MTVDSTLELQDDPIFSSSPDPDDDLPIKCYSQIHSGEYQLL